MIYSDDIRGRQHNLCVYSAVQRASNYESLSCPSVGNALVGNQFQLGM